MKIFLSISFLLIGSLAFAQTEGDEAEPDSTVLLTELIISANKIPETKNSVPQQVFLIGEQQIKNLSAQTTADLIANSGFVGLQKSQQGGGSPQLRGFEASRVVLVIDGVRMNNLIYRAGHLQNVITMDNNSLERAEILLGPSSTVYGSDALGGVIHLRTRQVSLSPTAQTQIKGRGLFRYSSANNEKTFHADVNIGAERFGSFTSVTHSAFGDLKMGEKENGAMGEPFGLREYYVVRNSENTADVLVENNDPYRQKFSGYSQLDVVQKFLFKPSSAVTHELNLQLSTSTDIPRYDRLTDPSDDGLRFAEWYYGPQERFMAAYTFSKKINGRLADEIVSTLSYQRIEESRHDRRFGRENRRNQIEKVDVIGVTVDLKKGFGAHAFRYGYDAQFNWLKSSAFNYNIVDGTREAVATRYPDGDNTMRNNALYFTHTFDINDQFTLTDGLRIGVSRLHSTFHDKTFFPFPYDEVKQDNVYASGNVGLMYQPKQSWQFILSGSTGFRVPNVDDLSKVFETSAGEALVVPNPDIKPEKTVNLDFGVRNNFSKRILLENRAFYTWFYDAIVLDDFTFNGQSSIDYEGQSTPVLANQNKRRAYLVGFSSLLEANISSLLTLKGSYNYTKGRIQEDAGETPLDHIPPAFGRVSVQLQKKQHTVELFSNFNAWKRIDDYLLNAEDNEQYATKKGMPSWYTINFRYDFKFGKRFDLLVGVDNIFDLQYRTFSSGINAPGRNFIARLLISLDK